MATRRTRRTRITLRCVREDLELDIPAVEVDLGARDHALVAEAAAARQRCRADRSGSSRTNPFVCGSVTAAGAARRGSKPTGPPLAPAPARYEDYRSPRRRRALRFI